MSKLVIKNITLMDDVETKEAEKLLFKHKCKYCAIYIVPLVIFFAVLIWFFDIITRSISTPFSAQLTVILIFSSPIISLIVLIVCIKIYKRLIHPYKELVKVAKVNDKVRHEEKIREQERQRLQAQFNNAYTKKDIINTINKSNLFDEHLFD